MIGSRKYKLEDKQNFKWTMAAHPMIYWTVLNQMKNELWHMQQDENLIIDRDQSAKEVDPGK